MPRCSPPVGLDPRGVEEERRRRGASLLRHPGLAEASEIGRFAQGSDFQCPIMFNSPQASDARITIVGAHPARLGEFGCSALVLIRVGGQSRLKLRILFRAVFRSAAGAHSSFSHRAYCSGLTLCGGSKRLPAAYPPERNPAPLLTCPWIRARSSAEPPSVIRSCHPCFDTANEPSNPPLEATTKRLAHEDAVVAGLGAASRLFISD